MNERQRFIKSVTFGNPDKIYLKLGGGRKSTHERWIKEGLPEGKDPSAFILEELGITRENEDNLSSFFINSRMIPIFEEKICFK